MLSFLKKIILIFLSINNLAQASEYSISHSPLVAVGSYYDIGADQFSPLSYISRDLGNSWQLSKTLPPPLTHGFYNELSSVSCNIAGKCIAVGTYFDEEANKIKPLSYISEDFGNNWCLPGSKECPSARLPKFPSFAFLIELKAVECDPTSKSFNCVAVGQITKDIISYPIIYTSMNLGNTWEKPIFPSAPTDLGSGLNSIACHKTGVCVSVGQYFIDDFSTAPLTYVSNDFGKSWCLPGSDQCPKAQLPEPPGKNYNNLTSVTCDESQGKNCVAVGYYYLGEEGIRQPFVYTSQDQGHTWSKPIYPANSSKLDSLFTDVSCNGEGYCLAVGTYTAETGYEQALTYISNDFGHTWCFPGSEKCPHSTLPPESEYGSFLNAVFCSQVNTKCSTVGISYNLRVESVPLLFGSNNLGETWNWSNLMPPSFMPADLRAISGQSQKVIP